MLVLIEKQKGNQTVEYPLESSIIITAEPGAIYTIKDTETGAPPEDLVLKKKGEVLEVEVDGETVAQVEAFFAAESDTLFSADGSEAPPDDMAVAGDLAVPEDVDSGVLVVWEADDPGMSAGWIAGLAAAGGIGLAVAATSGGGGGGGETTGTDTTAPTVTITDNTEGTAASDVTYTFTFSEPVAGFTADDVDVTGGSKGTFTAISDTVYTLVVAPNDDSTTDITVDVDSGVAVDAAGNSNTAATQSVQSVDTGSSYFITINAAAGTFTSTLRVELYDQSGNLIVETDHDFSTGSFSYQITNGYTGIVFAKVSDLNTEDDYTDETTGTMKNLGTTLRAMAQTDGEGNVSMTVSPLTELAVQLAGIDEDNLNLTTDDLAFNEKVGDLFDVDDITGPVTTVTQENYDSSNGLDAGEQYGNVLAMLSGVDENTGSVEETIKQIESTIVQIQDSEDSELGLTQDGVELLQQGIDNYTAGESGNTANLSDLLLKPPVIDAARGGGITAQEKDAGVVVALSDVSEGDTVIVYWGGETYQETITAAHMNNNNQAEVTIPSSIIETAGDAETLAVTYNANGGDKSPAVIIRVDTHVPGIQSVSIPDTAMSVGDTVTATITVDSDTDTYTSITGTIDGFALSNLTKVSDTEYTAQFTITDGGTDVADTTDISVDITITDTAGNASTAYTTGLSQNRDPIDANRPTLDSVTPGDGATDVAVDVNLTLTFSEAVYQGSTGNLTIKLTSDDSEFETISITDPRITGWGTTTLTVNPDGSFAEDTGYYVVFDDNAVLDAGGSPAAPITDKTEWNFATPDNTPPTVAITDNIDGTATGDVTYTFTFSEPVTGFTAGDVDVTGGSKGTFTAVSDTVYTLVVTPNADSTTDITVDVPANIATDAADNGNTAAIQSVQAVDTTAPTVAITDDTTGTATGDVTYTFTFSEAVTGFTADDVDVTGGSKGTFTAVSDTVYTLVVAPDAGSTTDITVDVAANVATDAADNGNTAAIQSVQAVDTTVPDTTAPTVAITDDTAGTATGDVTYTFTFSEPVTGFTAGDVDVTGGSKGTFTAISGTVYTLVVTPNTDSTTDITVDVAANIATDAADNGNTAAIQSVQAVDTTVPDTTAPTVAITDDTAGTATGDVTYTFTFSEAMTGFTADDVDVTGGSKGTFTAISGTVYTLVVTPNADSTTDITVDVAANIATDTADNGNTAAIQSVQAVDTTAPTVAITDDTAGTATGDVTYTFTFSEPVTGFTASDVDVTGGRKGTFTAISGTVYTLVVRPNADSTTDITVDVAANVATDAADNGNTAAIQSVQAVDTIAPTVAITDDTAGTATGDVTYTFTFSEAVTGFTADDVDVTGGRKGTFTAISGTVYTLVVTPNADSTTDITVDVPANIATDAADNGNTAAIQSVQAVDTTAPTVAITDDTAGTATGDVTYTFTFSEAVTGFTADDVDVTGGSKGTFTAISGTVYTLVVTPNADSTTDITVDVAANVATDAADNGNTAAIQSVQAVDTIAPTVAITDDTAGTATSNVTYTFTFSEAVTGFTADDVDVTGGSKGTFTAISGTVYTLVVTPNADSTTDITVDVPANIATDAADNGNTAAIQSVQAVDTTAPTVAITDDTAGTATGDVTYTFTFSEAVTGFTADDVDVTGGSKGTFTAISGTVYTLVVTPNADSTTDITVDVAANVATDAADNGNTAAIQSVQAVDTIAPTVAITDDTAGTATSNVTYTFTFSEAVTGFTADDVDVTGGSKGTFTAISGTVYTLVVTPNADSTTDITVDVPANIATDAADNGNTAAIQSVQAVDTTAPTVAITDDTAGTATGDVTYTFTFSEAVTGFTADDVDVTGGSKGTFTAISGTVYTLVVTPNADSTTDITVDVAANVATDAADNGNTAAIQSVQAVDTIAPTVAITDDTAGTATGDVTYTFTFSEAVTGFTADDVDVTGGSKGTFTAISGTVYTLVVTPNADSTTDITVDVPANVATDAADNGNTAAIQSVQAVDTIAPTVAITDDTAGTATGDVTYTFTFSEPVTGFTADDVDVTGGSKGTFTAISGTVYTLVVTPNADSTTDITVDVAANVATDAADNGNTAAIQSVQAVDTIAPTVAITDDTAGTATGDVTYTFTFSEPVTGFTADDVDVTGGSKGTFTAISGTVYTLVVTPNADSTTDITVDVPANVATDAADNGNTAAIQSVQAVDTIAPTVAITDDTAGTATGDVTYTFTFSEAVTGFTADDVDVTGGSKGTFTAISGTVYTLVVTPNADSTTDITVDVPANVATDAADNGNTAAIQSVQAVDTIAPTVAITDDTAGTATGDVTYTFTFSEAVTGFTADDVDVTGGSKGTFTAISGTVYTLVVRPNADSTTDITVDVPANIATDAADNGNTAAIQSVQAVDTIAPTVAITDDTAGTATGDVTYTFTFSEPVTGFTADDVDVTGGSKGTFTAISGTVYTLVVRPNADSTTDITVDVAANVATDAADNGNTAAIQSVQAVDTIAPTVAITDDTAGTATGDVTYTFTFSEPVTGFTADDVDVTGGSKGTFTAISGTVYTLVVTPNADSTTDITVDVPANVATDAADNGNTAAIQSVQAVDTIAPTVAITDDTAGTATGDVTYTFTFSEAVTGFTADDVDVTGGSKGTFTAISGTVYTLVVTPNADSTTDITVDVAANIATDAADNGNTAAIQSVQAVDTIAPTVAITDDTAGTATSNVTYTFTFSEAVTGFTADDVDVTGGSKGTFTAISGTVYTLVVTPNADSTTDITVDVPANVATDAADNGNTAAIQSVQAVDTIAPTVAITDDTAGTATGDVTYTFTFSEPVTGFTADDVDVTGGSKGTFTAISGTVYTLVVTPNADSTTDITVDVPANVATDAADNGNTAAIQSVQAVDTIAPTVAITDDTAGTATGDVTYTFTFSEAVTGFTADDVDVTGGSKGTFTAISGTVYTLVVTPNADSTTDITVDVPANVATDAADNGNTAAIQSVQAVDTTVPDTTVPDTTAPTVAITDDTAGTATGDVIYTFTFSEPVTGFTVGDVDVTGGSKGTFTAISGTVYTLVVTPNADSTTDITVDVAANVATDAAVNSNTAAEQSVQAVDTQIPAVPSFALATDTGSSDSDGITNNTIISITGLEENASWQYSTDAGSTWETGTGTSFELADGAYAQGTIQVKQTDTAGNISQAGTNAIAMTVDTEVSAPSFDMPNDTGSNTSDGITNEATVNVTLASDVASWQYSTDGGTGWTDGTGTSFELADGAYAQGTIQVKQTDTAGNISQAGTNAIAMTVDTEVSAPPFDMPSDTGSNTSDGITNEATVNVTLAADAASWQYSTDGGGTWATGTGTSFELTEGSYGSNAIQVRQTDTAGNTSEAAANDSAITVDTTALAPSFSLASDSGSSGTDSITNDATINVTLADDAASWQYSTDGGGTWETGTGTSFELTEGSYGSNAIQVRQTDTAGNTSEAAANDSAITVDTTALAPSFSLASDSGSSGTDSITNDATINVTLADDAASWQYSTDGGGTWETGTGTSFELTEGSYGSNAIQVRQTDTAGNTSEAAANDSAITVDTTALAPSFSLASDSGSSGTDSITNDATINVTLADDAASWQYSTDGGGTWETGTGTSFELTEGSYGSNAIQVRQTDTAGNTSEAAANDSAITVDTTALAPSFSLASDSGSSGTDSITNDATINVTLADDAASWQYSTDGGGTWETGTGTSFELTEGSYGSNAIQVRQTDTAGNTSEAAANTSAITVDTTALAPSFSLASDSGSSGTDSITNDATINVTLADDAASWQYSTDGGGTWETGTGTSFELIEGSYGSNAIQVRQTDTAGNTSEAAANTSAITVDTTALAPSFSLASDSGSSGTDSITNDATINVTLAADAASWEYSINGGSWEAGTGTGTNASFELTEGSYGSNAIQVRQTDAAGNTSEIAKNDSAITVDTTAPTLSSSSPADEGTDVAIDADISLTFSETIQAGTGNIKVYDSTDSLVATVDVTDSDQVSISGDTLTLNLTGYLSNSTSYYVQMDSGAVEDAAGNDFGGIDDATTLNFTTVADTTAPTLSSSSPADEGTDVAIDADISLTFSETIQAGTGNIKVYDSTDSLVATVDVTDSDQVSISGDTLTLNLTGYLSNSTSYYVQMDSGAVEDAAGNDFGGIDDATTLNFTTVADTTAPTLSSSSPADEGTDVAIDADISLTFSETIQAGTGNIKVYDSTDSLVATVDVTDSDQVSISGDTLTLNLTGYLSNSTSYYVQMDSGAVEDAAGNDFGGIDDATTLNFTTVADTTAPTLSSSSPADEGTDVAIDADISLTFSETIQAGTGNIKVYDSTDSLVATVDVTDSTQVSISEETLTLDLTGYLSNSTSYYVQMDSGAVKDDAGNDFGGIDDATTLNFTTVADTTAPTLSSSSPADEGTDVAIDADINLTFSETIQAGTGNIYVYDSTDSLVATVDVTDSTQVSISEETLTLDLTGYLNNSTSYYVQMDSGAVKDAASNDFGGIDDATTLNFTTVTVADTTPPSIDSVTASWGETLSTEDNIDGTVTVTTTGAENGQDVIVTLNGSDYTGTVSNNSADITITAAGLQALEAGNDYSLTVNVSDAAGNAAEPDSSTSFSVFDVEVVFNLTTGYSTDVGEGENSRVFQADTIYAIYIKVNSSNTADGSLSADNEWTNAEKLGNDDTIILVGSGEAVLGHDGKSICKSDFTSGYGYIIWYSETTPSATTALSIRPSGPFWSTIRIASLWSGSITSWKAATHPQFGYQTALPIGVTVP